MTILFPFPGNEELTLSIKNLLGYEMGDMTLRHFPDGESFVKIGANVRGKDLAIVCSLDRPDQKAMALMFFAQSAKELGATQVGLIAPYLGYMRQDTRFHEGEAVTSAIFAQFLSAQVDWLVTINPHLHRYKSLEEIYTIPCKTLQSADLIASWITTNVEKPFLIGPDEESTPLVSAIASKIRVPFIVLKKIRHGDKDVEIALPNIEKYKSHTPILIDDIISTGRTLIEIIVKLHNAGMDPPVCIGVHSVFTDGAYETLKNAGVSKIITSNTISHISNAIDVSSLLCGAVQEIKLKFYRHV
jgi:ribose-phosphate pyrophosphokinase